MLTTRNPGKEEDHGGFYLKI